MSVEIETAPSSKKAMAKKRNNPGTFSVEHPKKVKKGAKLNSQDDKPARKKKAVSNGSAQDSSPSDDIKSGFVSDKIEGMDVDVKPKKKRSFGNENNDDASPSKKAKPSPEFPKGAKFNPKFKAKKGFQPHSKKMPTSEGSEKPDWNKLKEEKKALREKRRAAQNADTHEVSIEAKKILDSIRSRKCPADEQIKQLQKLYHLLKGKLLAVVYAHDMSRVVETMLKLAHSHNQADLSKNMIKELLSGVLEMSKRKYATHVVRFMIEHSQPVERALIVKAFTGQVMKLLSHKIGHIPLEQLYAKVKTEDQCELKKELYGGSSKLVTKTVTGLQVIFDSVPSMKETTLTNTKDILVLLLQKNAVQSRIVHSVLLDYLNFAADESKAELLDQAKDHVKELIVSKEGVHIAMMCLWNGGPKARKKIIKELKDGVVSLACGEHSHMLLLAVFDTVDDTVIVQKAILTELLAGDLSPLLSSTYGRKVLMYVCSRRNPKMFTPPIIAVLAAGDNNPHSKKDPEARASELQKFAVPFLLESVAQNTSLWMENNPNLLVLIEVLKVGSGDKLKSALKAIANYVTNPPNPQHMGIDLRVAENGGCHMMLKKLAQLDKTFMENGLATFREALIPELTDRHYLAWLKNNRCCFLLLEILKNGSDEVAANLQSKIKSLASVVWKEKGSKPEGGKRIQEIL